MLHTLGHIVFVVVSIVVISWPSLFRDHSGLCWISLLRLSCCPKDDQPHLFTVFNQIPTWLKILNKVNSLLPTGHILKSLAGSIRPFKLRTLLKFPFLPLTSHSQEISSPAGWKSAILKYTLVISAPFLYACDSFYLKDIFPLPLKFSFLLLL